MWKIPIDKLSEIPEQMSQFWSSCEMCLQSSWFLFRFFDWFVNSRISPATKLTEWYINNR